MRMLKRLFILVLGVLLAFSLTGCKENEYVRVAVPEYVDGVTLYLTGKAAGKQKVANYVFFDAAEGDKYVDDVMAKMAKPKAGVDVAYFEVEDLDRVFDKAEELGFDVKIVFVDAYNSDGSIKSVWVARQTYISSCPKYFPKFVKGLVSSAAYRAQTNEGSTYANNSLTIEFAEKDSKNNVVKDENGNVVYYTKTFANYQELKQYMIDYEKQEGSWLYNLLDFTDYNFNDFTNIYQYCAIYNIQNSLTVDPTNGVEDTFFASHQSAVLKTNHDSYSLYCANDLTDKSADGYYELNAQGQALLSSVLASCDTSKEFDEVFELKSMIEGLKENEFPTPSQPKDKLGEALIWGIGLFVLVGVVVFFVVRRRIKTGKKIFDIKAALDADIVKED